MNPITDTNPLATSLIRAAILEKEERDGTWYYAWKQVATNFETGGDVYPLAPKSGTLTINPAVEINNNEVDVDTYVWLRQRGRGPGGTWWEFAHEVSAGAALTTGMAQLASDYTISANNTWELVPSFTLALPSAGEYEVWGELTTTIIASTVGSPVPPGIFFYVEFVNGTYPGGAPTGAGGIANEAYTTTLYHTRSCRSTWNSTGFTLDAGTTLQLRVLRDIASSGSFTLARIDRTYGSYYGYTRIGYTKLS